MNEIWWLYFGCGWESKRKFKVLGFWRVAQIPDVNVYCVALLPVRECITSQLL